MNRSLYEGGPLIRVALIGSGGDGDPFRADLPSYQLIRDLGGGAAIVQIRDDFPDLAAKIPTTADSASGRRVITRLTRGQRDEIIGRLRDRYGRAYPVDVT